MKITSGDDRRVKETKVSVVEPFTARGRHMGLRNLSLCALRYQLEIFRNRFQPNDVNLIHEYGKLILRQPGGGPHLMDQRTSNRSLTIELDCHSKL